MASLQLRALRAFTDNYIWVLQDAAGTAVVVDPGDAAPVEAAMERGLAPVAVLLTHHHRDHVGGAARLRELGVRCIAPDDPRVAAADLRVRDGDQVQVPELSLRFAVIEVPGHTASHVAFTDGRHLFCGDTLFSLGCGRLFEGTPAQMHASLQRLAALPDETLVCCGHEYTEANGRFARAVEPENPAREAWLQEAGGRLARGEPSLPSRMAVERAANPFLRCDAPAVREACARRLGHAPRDAVETLASLREWKDGFAA
jgi:hydroxyacylglutathione hydrolase